MTFLLRKAETAQERREREQREAREEKETQSADDASREQYKRYQQLFSDLNFAERALEPLNQLSEDMKIIVDDEKATGFDFENISAYNKVISKRESAIAYNILSMSLSESFNPLTDYDFTEENENGDVVLKPQVPPVPKKTAQERGELRQREYEGGNKPLTVDADFSIFSEEDSAPKNVPYYEVQDKKREIKLNPEINITKLFEDYKELATKTYDEFKDRSGDTLTFEKAFLYLHYNRHGFLPENAKNSKIRGADIERARKLARRRKRETRDTKSYGAAFLQYKDMKSSRDRPQKRKEVNRAIKNIISLKGENDSALNLLSVSLESLDNTIQELSDKKGNIKVLAKEALKRKLPEIKTIFEYEWAENPLAEIFPSQPKTISPEYTRPKGLTEVQEEQAAQRDMRRRVQSGDIDLDNPTSEGEKLIARANKRILDSLNHQQEKQKEVRATLRDASRFSNDLELAFKLINKSTEEIPFNIDSVEKRLNNEEDKQKPDEDTVELLKKQIKVREEYNRKLIELDNGLVSMASSLEKVSGKLQKLNPKMKELAVSKEEYNKVISDLIEVNILGSFTALGREYKNTKLEDYGIKAEQTKDINKLITILERKPKYKVLIADKEALSILKDADDFIQEAFKLEDIAEGMENVQEDIDKLLGEEAVIGDKLDKIYQKREEAMGE